MASCPQAGAAARRRPAGPRSRRPLGAEPRARRIAGAVNMLLPDPLARGWPVAARETELVTICLQGLESIAREALVTDGWRVASLGGPEGNVVHDITHVSRGFHHAPPGAQGDARACMGRLLGGDSLGPGRTPAAPRAEGGCGWPCRRDRAGACSRSSRTSGLAASRRLRGAQRGVPRPRAPSEARSDEVRKRRRELYSAAVEWSCASAGTTA